MVAMKIGTVLALTDCDDESVAGIRMARELCQRKGAKLVLGHVLVPRTLGRGDVTSLLKKHGIPEDAGRVVVEVDADLLLGLEHLVQEVTPDLVVLSSHRRSGIGALLFANTPALLASWGHAPILSLPAQDGTPKFRKAMVCVDGSPQSQALMDAAATVLGDKSEIVAVFVVEDSPLVVAGVDVGRFDRAVLDEAAAQATAFLKSLRLSRPDLSLRIDQRTGDAVDLILEAEREHEPDLVVIGTAGIGGKARFVLGKVATAVIRHAQAAVLTLPTKRPAP
jgi:nucleotide-binding universal stress UspA family protein